MIDEQRSTAARRPYHTMAGIAEVLTPATSGPAEPDTAVRRIIGGYLAGVRTVELTVNHHVRRRGPGPAGVDMFASIRDAMSWFGVVRADVLAAQQVAGEHRWDDLTVDFAVSLWTPLSGGFAWNELVAAQHLGAVAARRLHHPDEAVCWARLGFAYTGRAEHDLATHACTTGVDVATAAQNARHRAIALASRARTLHAAGRTELGLSDVRKALALAEDVGDSRLIALCHRRAGEVLAHPTIGRHADAVGHLRLAASIVEQQGDELAHARTLTALGKVHLAAHEPDQAAAAMTPLLSSLQHSGFPCHFGELLATLGEVHIQRGDIPNAQLYLMCATDYYVLADATDAVRAVRERLSRLS